MNDEHENLMINGLTEEGRDDFNKGIKLNQSPYTKGTKEYMWWSSGWEVAAFSRYQGE